jgi:uncharacterized protein YwgA
MRSKMADCMREPQQQFWDYIFLLNLFECSEEPLDNLKIQKVTFISEDIARREQNLKAAHFPFFRYNQGPYSKILANDVRKLEDFGFIHPETRCPTERGRYILDYVNEFVQRSKTAQESLRILSSVCKEYRDVRSSKLVDLVYKMKVSVSQFHGKVMTVKDIPLYTDIIDPDSEELADIPVFTNEALEDLKVEFSLGPEDLNPDNPANIALARAALDAAISR